MRRPRFDDDDDPPPCPAMIAVPMRGIKVVARHRRFGRFVDAAAAR